MLFGFHGRCCVRLFIAASVDQSVRPEAKLLRLCALPFEQMKLHPVAFFEAIWRWVVETVKIRIGQIFCLAGPPFGASNGDVESKESKGHSRRSDTKPRLAKCWSRADDCTTPSNFLWHKKELLKVCCIIEFNSVQFRCSATLVLFGFHSSEGMPCHHHSPSIEKTGFQPSIILVF